MKYWFFVLFSLFFINLTAQNAPGTQLPIRKAKSPIHVDGVLDEADWQAAYVAKDFKLSFPVDTALAPFQTEARLMFDDHNIYIGFVCYDDDKPYIVQSLKRDFDFDNNDNVSFIFGPYNDKQNGFFFTITPFNVQMEGTVSGGGAGDNGYSANWDNRWFSKTTRLADRWIAEVAIPLKSIRYKTGEWTVNFLRWDRKHNQASSWVAVPIQYNLGAMAYAGQMIWEDAAPKPSMNISLIPYVAGGLSRDSEANPPENSSDLQIGGDAKIGITPSMNLDLTVNPDFSQVEVDQQVVNLTRFEFQFPERRQFFLENNDLFQNAGFPDARPFFSRRIGLAFNDSTENLERVPIAFGARLSGSINKKWRLSAMNMQTKESRRLGLPKQNYTVATLMRNFGNQSSVAVTYVDKTSLGLRSIADSVRYFNSDVFRDRVVNGDSVPYFNEFSRSLGVDLEMLSKDNKWYGGSYYAISQNPFVSGNNHTGGIFGRFNNRAFDVFLGSSFLGKNYNSETGFVPAHGVYPGQWSMFTSLNYKLYPKNNGIAVMGPVSQFNVTYTPDGTLTDQNYEAGYSIEFKNSMSLQGLWQYNYSRLTSTFNPIDRNGDKGYLTFNENEVYDWHALNIEFSSNQRKVFSLNTEATIGEFLNGTAINLRGRLSYRYQPYGSLALRFDYNDVRLATGYGKEKLFVVGPNFDLTFTNSLFLTTFVQFNNVADNVNLNMRLQWRYKPASDFFIVYTENYLPENFKSKNRALVFKFTYWLNM